MLVVRGTLNYKTPVYQHIKLIELLWIIPNC